jgi:uncharacterized protein YndB with AHSA1/START domain
MKITIETEVNAASEVVWTSWITPSDIIRWNFASEDWCCPNAEITLENGGTFRYRMEAKDGSMGFDFEGTFTKIVPTNTIHFSLGDGRLVMIEFQETDSGVKVVETFEVEDEHTAEQQKQGWQSILNNFKNHVESKGK